MKICEFSITCQQRDGLIHDNCVRPELTEQIRATGETNIRIDFSRAFGQFMSVSVNISSSRSLVGNNIIDHVYYKTTTCVIFIQYL